jgi:hypothetical protein
MNRPLSIILALLAIFPLAALAQDTNAPDALDKNALELIVRKNIFDPTRVGGRTSGRRSPRAESFTFCGGAFDGPRAVAFFSGFGASNKPLQPGDTINGFKVDDITFKSVRIQPASGPPITLDMSMSMRREPNGPWKLSELPAPADEPAEASASSAASSSAAAPASSANDSDIIKRLKAQREDN